MRLKIFEVADHLPMAFDALRDQARTEGYRFLDRLADDWSKGATRFDGEGEALLVVEADGVVAGIGGLTVDPTIPDALRMRRFYVQPSCRRQGIARAIASDLIRRYAGQGKGITVNAATTMASGFWEALGIEPRFGPSITHSLPTDKQLFRTV
jgi:GNAT superfamily N-acetyltransferase